MVIRSLHETLFYVIDSPKDIKTVLEVMTSLSANNEPVLRTDLMEQVPQIAFLCHDHPDKLGGLVTGNLVPMVVKFLTDQNDLVRKTAQAALLVLLEQELVSHKDVNDQVCPVILDLTEPDAIDYFKTEALALMSKMAPLVGREMTERLFMERFTRLCSDTLFQVRKVCAANFGELSGVVGTPGTESVLLPHFLNLCGDGVWGVRKACADVFMVVSCACSLETRKVRLAPLFVSLLSDESRWVRLAAFQNLGPFISTFADPTVTGLHYNDQGILFIGSPPQQSGDQTQQPPPSPPLDADNIVKTEALQKPGTQGSEEGSRENCEYEGESSPVYDGGGGGNSTSFGAECPDANLSDEEDEIIDRNNENLGIHFDSSPFSISSAAGSSGSYVEFIPIIDTQLEGSNSSSSSTSSSPESSEDDPEFNEINYWKIPLPEVEIDFDLLEEEQQPPPQPPPPPQQQSLPPLPLESDSRPVPPERDDPVEAVVSSSENAQEDDGGEESSPNHISRDIVQEELEALAASLAESIFCSDSNAETKMFYHERVRGDEAGGVEGSSSSSSSSSASSSSSSFNSLVGTSESNESSSAGVSLHPESKLTYPECPKPTYAEVCASSSFQSSHKTENNSDSERKKLDGDDVEKSAPVDSSLRKDDENSSTAASNGSEVPITLGESRGSENFLEESSGGDESFLLGKYDCSKSLHNLTSFSNLSVLNSGGSRQPDSEANNSIYNIWSSEKTRSFREAHKMFQINANLNQDIVPKTLLEHYISMTDPVQAETVDEEITRHCAFSLPAVALTLGRKYWFVLSETYAALASDMHWKVRRTLAFSIHEMAIILGEELAQKDLLPVFEGFIKDLDEVRIGVLKHLSHFLKMLPPPQRKLFLPRLNEFLNPDNAHNWRFRLELALQLAPISELFTAQECWAHICPITFDLMGDKVVEIRRTCFGVVSQLSRQLIWENKDNYMNTHIVPFSEKLIEEFAQAETWTRRQSYAYVVGQIIKDNSLPLHIVCYLFLPKFLELSEDKVPNIRLVVARIINTDICSQDYFHHPENEASSRVREVLFKLQNDPDRDVHYFASYSSSSQAELSETENQDSNFY